MFFTSGSTGRSKGVVLSHRASYLRSFPNLITDWDGRRRSACFPLFHMSGWSMALNAWQMRLPVHFAAPEATRAARDDGASTGHAASTACPRCGAGCSRHGPTATTSRSVRECDTGTSATPPELLRAIKDAFPGTATRIYYGSTEAGPASLLGDADLERKPGSVGSAGAGRGPAPRDDGEVCVRSAFLMDGYFEAARRDRRGAARRLVSHG